MLIQCLLTLPFHPDVAAAAAGAAERQQLAAAPNFANLSHVLVPISYMLHTLQLN